MENIEQKKNEKLEIIRSLVLEEVDDLSAKFDHQIAELGYGETWARKAEKIREGEKLERDETMLKIVIDIAFPRCSSAELDYVIKEFFKPGRVPNQPAD